MAEATGATAVALALEQQPEEPEDEQLGLFAPAQTEEGILKQKIKRPGRPLGSKNKRTERTVAFLLARHRDPRAVLLEIAEANVHDLAALLGCSVHEALAEKRLAAIGVLPYIAQKQPIGIDLKSRSIVYLNIFEGDPSATSDGLGIGLAVPLTRQLEGEATVIDVTDQEPDA